jgi:hypothetical protein
MLGGAEQAAEKLARRVIPRSRKRRGISHRLENTQGEILHSTLDWTVQGSTPNDSLQTFFRSL